MGLGISHMPRSTCSYLGLSQCMDDLPRYAVVECLSLENIFPIALQVERRAHKLQA